MSGLSLREDCKTWEGERCELEDFILPTERYSQQQQFRTQRSNVCSILGSSP